MASFLRDCADQLNSGSPALDVILQMRNKYSTVRCLSSKMSIVRRMCTPTKEFIQMAGTDALLLSGKKNPPANFPSRFPINIQGFRLELSETRECKRLGNRARVSKNRRANVVDGRAILKSCREEVLAVHSETRRANLRTVLAVMLLIGRRTCEVLNDESIFEPIGPYEMLFTGQAKQHSQRTYAIPVLDDAKRLSEVVRILHTQVLRTPQTLRPDISKNKLMSQRYQSILRRTLLAHDVLSQVGKLHSLRGIYACMCYRLFTWSEPFSEAFVVMQTLGHVSILESLVYTPLHLGKKFIEEPLLDTVTGVDRFWN